MIREIEIAPESVVREAHDFFLFLKSRRLEEAQSGGSRSDRVKPDFLARQQALFGSRVVADSQSNLDVLRAERF